MAIDPSRNSRFKALAEQVRRELTTQGFTVVDQTVIDVLLTTINSVAEQIGVKPSTAMGYIEPGAIAQRIVQAAVTQGMHGLRPVRDGRRAELPSWISGPVVAALAQTAKYAISNHDDQTADHAADLLTEIGMALTESEGTDSITTDHGVWAEAADLLEKTADHIAAGEWVHCRCGTDHGTAKLDAGMPARLRTDAALARQIASSCIDPPRLHAVPTPRPGGRFRTPPPV